MLLDDKKKCRICGDEVDWGWAADFLSEDEEKSFCVIALDFHQPKLVSIFDFLLESK